MQNVLITGAAGFIGYYTSRQLIERGYSVTGIDNINNYYDPALKLKRLEENGIMKEDALSGQLVTSHTFPSFRFIKADIADAAALNDLFKNGHFDLVINLAAQPGARYSVENPESYLHSNITGFLNILEACRHYQPRHLVYASSSSVYGNNELTPYAEVHKTDSPASLYGASKKSNELMAYAYSHLYGIPMTGLRFFTVYGPWGRPDMVYFKYTHAILNEKPIDVYNHGKLKRDYTYVDDIVKGIMDLLPIVPDGSVPHQVFNIGNSEPVELLEFIETLERVLGKKAIKNMMGMQQGDVLITYADTAKLEKYCGYKPYTSIEEGLKRFTEWYFEKYLKF